MSWYFFGGFSAYAIVPSARVVNHSGWLVTQGWSGAHCSARSSATSRPTVVGLGDEGVEVVDRAEVGVDGVVAAVLGADRPRRAGVALGRGQGVVGALAVDLADRVDRRQVDDVEAHVGDGVEPLGRGREGAAGDLAGLGVVGRALGAREELVPAAVERARAVGVHRERALDGDQVAQRVARRAPRSTSGTGSAASRAAAGRFLSRRGLDRAVERPRGAALPSGSAGTFVRATRSSSRSPSVNISSTSISAAILISASCFQVPNGSDHASTRRSRRRRRPGVTQAVVAVGHARRAWSSGPAAGAVPSGSVSTTSAPSMSWPSRNTLAVTGNGSPTVALAGWRPRSTSGVTFMTGMRPTMRSNLARLSV